MPKSEDEPEDIQQRIETFMGEFRIIVPALAAIFGFQLISAFQQSFESLSTLDKTINFVGLASSAMGLLFLLVPPNYHRFTTQLEESLRFLNFAQRNYSIAFVFIPIGITASLYIQAVRSFDSQAQASAIAAFFLVAFAVGWWILPFLRARKNKALPRRRHERERASA